MIRLPTFEFMSPATLSELTDVLAQGNGDTKILAGGTDLIVNIKHGMSAPRRVVWLGKVSELRRIAPMPDGELRIGAMCTLEEVAESLSIHQKYPSLAKAVRSIASPAIRNRATLGGNLCLDSRCYFYDQSEFWRCSLGGCLKLNVRPDNGEGVCHAAPGLHACSSVFSSDAAPLLIALDASVRLASAEGERIIPLSDFYINDGVEQRTLRHGEVLAEVILPAPLPGWNSFHGKIRSRASIDFPLANIGAALHSDGHGNCHRIRLIVGAVQSAPIRLPQIEEMLLGRQLSTELIEHAAEQAGAFVRPIPNIAGTVGYRVRMVRVLVRRALTELTRMA